MGGAHFRVYTVKRKAYAKINLMLNVLGKRPDGYHDLETVMQAVSLCDEITVAITPREGGAGDSYGRAGYGCGGAGLAPLAKGGMAPATSPPLPKGGWRQQDLRRQGGLVCDGGGVGGAGDAGVVQTPIERLARILAGSIRITINSSDAYITSQLPSIPTDARNTVHKAVIEYFKLLTSKNYARLAKEPYAPLETINNRISISIDKMIPAAAGLGGGSSDAAAVLLALNDIVGYAAKNVGERGGLHGINSGINSGINGGLNGVNGGINGGINDGVNDGINEIIVILLNASGLNAIEIANRISKSPRTTERYLGILRKKEIIEYRGSKKTGGYYLTEKAKEKLK